VKDAEAEKQQVEAAKAPMPNAAQTEADAEKADAVTSSAKLSDLASAPLTSTTNEVQDSTKSEVEDPKEKTMNVESEPDKTAEAKPAKDAVEQAESKAGTPSKEEKEDIEMSKAKIGAKRNNSEVAPIAASKKAKA